MRFKLISRRNQILLAVLTHLLHLWNLNTIFQFNDKNIRLYLPKYGMQGSLTELKYFLRFFLQKVNNIKYVRELTSPFNLLLLSRTIIAFITTSAQQSQPYFSRFCRLFVNFFYDFKKVLFEKKGSNMLL